MNQTKVIAVLPIKGMDCIKRIYGNDGFAPTISTMQGGATRTQSRRKER